MSDITPGHSSIPEDELHRKIRCLLGYCDVLQHECLFDSNRNEIQELDKIMAAIRQYAAKARLDERKRVALDNYHGHTFSDETNYKYKFDKFIKNNERRIKQLKDEK